MQKNISSSLFESVLLFVVFVFLCFYKYQSTNHRAVLFSKNYKSLIRELWSVSTSNEFYENNLVNFQRRCDIDLLDRLCGRMYSSSKTLPSF